MFLADQLVLLQIGDVLLEGHLVDGVCVAAVYYVLGSQVAHYVVQFQDAADPTVLGQLLLLQQQLQGFYELC